MYDFELEKALSEVKNRGAKRVLVQAPDGLKQFLEEFVSRLSSTCEVYISLDPCYGGCDLEDKEAAELGADMVIHIGHMKFIPGKEDVHTIYLTAPHVTDISGLSKGAAEAMREKGFRKVGLVANIQHVKYINDFRSALEGVGIAPIVDSETGGLVLGCRTEGAKRIDNEVDAFLFIGGGDFHPLGVALDVEKEVYTADPYRGEIRSMAELKRKTLARRWWAIMEGAKSRRFGVITVTKRGQLNLLAGEAIARELKEWGKEVYMLAGEEVNRERLSAFPFIDAFVVTGCPRISVDTEGWDKPVLNESEAREAIRIIKSGHR